MLTLKSVLTMSEYTSVAFSVVLQLVNVDLLVSVSFSNKVNQHHGRHVMLVSYPQYIQIEMTFQNLRLWQFITCNEKLPFRYIVFVTTIKCDVVCVRVYVCNSDPYLKQILEMGFSYLTSLPTFCKIYCRQLTLLRHAHLSLMTIYNLIFVKEKCVTASKPIWSCLFFFELLCMAF